MKLKLNALLVTIFLSSCTTTSASKPTLSFNQEEKVYKAIKSKNHKEVRNLLKDIDTLSQAVRFAFIYSSLNSGCFPDEIKFFLSKNNSPFTTKYKNKVNRGLIIISHAAQKICPDALELLSPLVSAQDFASAAYTSIPVISNYTSSDTTVLKDELVEAFRKLNKNSEADISRFRSTGKFLGTRIKEDCENSIQESCIAKSQLEDALKKMEQIETNQKWWDGPEGTFSKACSLYQELLKQQSYIDYQKEVERRTGVVNAAVLHRAGSQVVQLEHQLKFIKNKFQSQTKKIINLKECAQR